MAITKMWAVKGGLGSVGRVLQYTANQEKTIEKIRIPDNDFSKFVLHDSVKNNIMSREAKRIYVSSLNCSVVTAKIEMIAVKERFQKTDKIELFHGVQSFAPGEVSPETAHEIGIKLAEILWGDKFQVQVSTHLDKDHIHNHFVVNSVSFLTGEKYTWNLEKRLQMMKESDKLCEQYGLSVIKTQKKRDVDASIHRAAWEAKQTGRPHYNSYIRVDVDDAIKESVSMSQFIFRMKKKGYDIKCTSSHISVRPAGRKKAVRLDSWFGTDYLPEKLNERLLLNYSGLSAENTPMNVTLIGSGSLQSQRIVTSIGILYTGYRYRITSKNAGYIFRQDIWKLEKYSAHQNFIAKNKIRDEEDLTSMEERLQERLDRLDCKRKAMRNRQRTMDVKSSPEKSEMVKKDISELTAEMAAIRKDIKTCREIAVETDCMKRKIRAASATKNKEDKVWQDQNRSVTQSYP